MSFDSKGMYVVLITFRNTWCHVSASNELHIRHVIDRNLLMPTISCLLAFPMYRPIRNFSRFVFCEYVIAGLDQISLSMSGFIVHLLILGNYYAIISKLFSRSCLVMYV